MLGCICMPQIAPQDKEMAHTNGGFRSGDRTRDYNDWAGRKEKYFLAVV